MFAASLGIEPSDVVGLSYLEDDILEMGKKMFTRPFISSNTMSNSTSNNGKDGRPTNNSLGLDIADSTETGIENNGNHEDDIEV